MNLRRPLLFAMLLAAPAAACQLIVGVSELEGVARPDADVDARVPPAADGGPLEASLPPATSCVLARPPGTPGQASPAADKSDVVFALKNYQLGAADGGYDLDGRCTGLEGSPLGGSSCVARDGGTADLPNGVDDAFVTALPAGFTVGGLSEAVSRSAEEGRVTTLVRVSGYNGLADDDEVGVEVGMSPGVDSNTGPALPNWGGEDVWTFVEGAFAGKEPWKGYVVGGMLVVPSMEKVGVGLIGEAPFYDALLTARFVVGVGGELKGLTDGHFAGRVPPPDLLGALKGALFKLNDAPLCTKHLWSVLFRASCAARDVSVSKANDGSGMPCDAISVTFRFDAVSAKLGGVSKPSFVDCDAGPDGGGPDLDQNCN